jgi:hypothetical protein
MRRHLLRVLERAAVGEPGEEPDLPRSAELDIRELSTPVEY